MNRWTIVLGFSFGVMSIPSIGRAYTLSPSAMASDTTALTVDLAKRIGAATRVMDSLRLRKPRLPKLDPIRPETTPTKAAQILAASPELTVVISRYDLTPSTYAQGYIRIYKAWQALLMLDVLRGMAQGQDALALVSEVSAKGAGATNQDVDFVSAHEDELRAWGFTPPPAPQWEGGGSPNLPPPPPPPGAGGGGSPPPGMS